MSRQQGEAKLNGLEKHNQFSLGEFEGGGVLIRILHGLI